MQTFRDAVQKRLEETGITMTDLAKEANIGRAYLYRVLAGRQIPSIEVADRVAKALDLAILTVPVNGEKISE